MPTVSTVEEIGVRPANVLHALIEEELEKTTDFNVIIDAVYKFLYMDILNGGEAAAFGLRDPLRMYINHCHSVRQRTLLDRAANRVDGAGGPATYSTPDGPEDVLSPGILDKAVLADTYRLNGETISFGEATIHDHKALAERYQKLANGNQRRADRHYAAMTMINSGEVACLNDLV